MAPRWRARYTDGWDGGSYSREALAAAGAIGPQAPIGMKLAQYGLAGGEHHELRSREVERGYLERRQDPHLLEAEACSRIVTAPR